MKRYGPLWMLNYNRLRAVAANEPKPGRIALRVSRKPAVLTEGRVLQFKKPESHCDVSTVRNAGGFSYRKCTTHDTEWSEGGPCPVGGQYA